MKKIFLTRTLNQFVRRNIKRFPDDFMFQLNRTEFENWKSQLVISNSGKMSLRKLPLAFTEQGVAMLSSILRSDRVAAMNIAIMRTFVKLRELMATNVELREKVETMEKEYDGKIAMIIKDLSYLLSVDEDRQKKTIGFSIES